MQPKRNNYYDATIRRMVRESLAEKNRAFAEQHRPDSDEILLEYLRSCARELGHTPHAQEILGSELLTERFGDWNQTLERAGLPKLTTPDKLSAFRLWTEEEAEQKRIYTQRKAEKKALARLREVERERRKKEYNSPAE